MPANIVPYPGIRFAPGGGQSVICNITSPNGVVAPAFTDPFGVSPVSLPATITTPTIFYVAGEGPWVVSAKYNGNELAGQTIVLEDQQVATVTAQGTNVLSSSFGGLEAVTGPGGVVGAVTGASATWSLANGNWYDCQPNQAAVTLTVSGFANQAGCAGTLVLRPTVNGTLTISVAGGTVSPATVQYQSSVEQILSVVSDDGGVTVLVSFSTLTYKGAFPRVPLAGLSLSGSFNNGANAATFTAFWVDTPITVTKMAVYIGTSSGNVCAGIYDSTGTGGLPNNRLATTGSVACPVGTATQQTLSPIALTSSIILLPGLYWAAFSQDNTTTAIGYSSAPPAGIGLFTGVGTLRCDQASAAFPLPATTTATATASANTFIIYPASL